jgi:hypothetical protein
VFATGSRVGISEGRVVEHMAYVDEQGSETRSSLLVRSQQVAYIPHPEAEEEEEEEDANTCRYIALMHPCKDQDIQISYGAVWKKCCRRHGSDADASAISTA